MEKLKPTTVVIPADITQKLKQLKKKKNVPTFWRAIEVYFDEKFGEQLKALYEQQTEIFSTSIINLVPYTRAMATAKILMEKYPELAQKESALISQEYNNLLKLFPVSMQKLGIRLFEMKNEVDQLIGEIIEKDKDKTITKERQKLHK